MKRFALAGMVVATGLGFSVMAASAKAPAAPTPVLGVSSIAGDLSLGETSDTFSFSKGASNTYLVEDITFTLASSTMTNWLLSFSFDTNNGVSSNGLGGSSANPATMALYSGVKSDAAAQAGVARFDNLAPATLVTIPTSGGDHIESGVLDNGALIDLKAGTYTVEIVGATPAAAAGKGIVTITAVPEVSTWAMMLSGFASLGFVGFRRNNRARVSAL